MTDISTTIIPNSQQLNADDLILGPRTIEVTKVTASGGKDQPVAISYVGDFGKPFYPCKTVRRVLCQIWGANAAEYIGRSMTLYRDPSVKWGGLEVGGIRISHMSHIDNDVTLVLTASKTSRKPFTVKPLKTEPTTPTNPDVKAAGDEAAKGGVESYTKWLATLTPDVKETVRWLHKEWTRVAKAVVMPDADEIAVGDNAELKTAITDITINLKNHGDSIDFTDTAKMDEWCVQEFDAKYADLNEPQLQTLKDELQDRLDAYAE